MLRVKKLDERANLPTVAYPGEDLGYDIYALEETWVYRHKMTIVRTGIAVTAMLADKTPLGLLVKDRSSLASRGVFTHGGVIDAGYRGEILVNLSTINSAPYLVLAGSKFAQMVPVEVLTGDVIESELPPGDRNEKGFGSSGT